MTILRPSYKHSAWSINMMLSNPGLWAWRQVFENWGEDSPRAQMGHVVEDVVAHVLSLMMDDFRDMDQLPTYSAAPAISAFYDSCHWMWDERTGGLIEPEREYVAPIALNMLRELDRHDLGDLRATQVRVPTNRPQFDGLETPFKAKVDLSFDDCDIDLKATLRLPSEPSPMHMRQIAIYRNLRIKPQGLLYATPKKSALYMPEAKDLEPYLQEALQAAKSIEAINDMCEEKEEITRLFPLRSDDFQWDDNEYQEAAKLWQR